MICGFVLQRRERNSLIKDLDPFHELHEQRKGECVHRR